MERIKTEKRILPTTNAIQKGKTYMEMIMPDLLKIQARKEIAEERKKLC